MSDTESKVPQKRPSGQPSKFKAAMMRMWNIWPPFVGTGISITKVEGDWEKAVRALEIRLKLRFWNANYVGTAFGGSIYAMTDPFYMVILARRLGREYVVWDKAANIRFKKPGTTDCYARFEITEDELDAIRKKVAETGKFDWVKKVEVKDDHGDIVAEVDKTLYIATKAHYDASRAAKQKPNGKPN